MAKLFVGRRKANGYEINTDLRIISFYEYLNVVEKIQKKEHIHSMKYDEIFYIEVVSHVVNEIRNGSINIFLNVHLWNGKKYHFPIYFNDTTREEIREFIRLLRTSSLDIRDEKGLFDEIVNSNQRMWELVERISQ
ncbi:MAG: hypothetical protein RR630_00695 [Coprobacillus sp.]